MAIYSMPFNLVPNELKVYLCFLFFFSSFSIFLLAGPSSFFYRFLPATLKMGRKTHYSCALSLYLSLSPSHILCHCHRWREKPWEEHRKSEVAEYDVWLPAIQFFPSWVFFKRSFFVSLWASQHKFFCHTSSFSDGISLLRPYIDSNDEPWKRDLCILLSVFFVMVCLLKIMHSLVLNIHFK